MAVTSARMVTRERFAAPAVAKRAAARASAAGCALALVLGACGGGGSDAQYAPDLMHGEQEEVECTEPAPEFPESMFEREGQFADVDYWDCERPVDVDGEFHIDAITGTEATVTGSTAEIELEWSGPDEIRGHNLLFWLGGASATRIRNGLVTRTGTAGGYYRYVIPNNDNPLQLQMFFAPDARGDDYMINFAIDDTVGDPVAPRIGAGGRQSLYLIEVGSGDIQINLNWNTLVDLDLHVIDPTGFEIYFGALEAPSGGMLDLDSYPGCNFMNDRGRGNENVFWSVGSAPEGPYLVQVDMWSDCGTYAEDTPTLYRVTIVSDGEVQSVQGSFDPSDPESIANDPRDVATFEF